MDRRGNRDGLHAADLADVPVVAGEVRETASETSAVDQAESPGNGVVMATATQTDDAVDETDDLASMLETMGVPPGLAERYGRMFDAVFDELAADERQLLMEAIPVLPNELRMELAQPMLTMSAKKAAEYVRNQVLPKVRKVVAESSAKDGPS